MPIAIADLVDHRFVVVAASTTTASALQAVNHAKPAFVVVQGAGMRLYTYPADGWTQRVAAMPPDTPIATALSLGAEQPDTLHPVTLEMSAEQIRKILAGALLPGRGALTIVDHGRPVGVLSNTTLERLRQTDSGPPPVSAKPPAGRSTGVTRGIGGVFRRAAPPRAAAPPFPSAGERVPPRDTVTAPVPAAGAPPPAAVTPQAQMQTLQPKAQAEFPPEVVAGENNILTVCLSTAADARGQALGTLSVAADVTEVPIQVYIQAPGFAIDGPNLQEATLPVVGEADPIDFTLRALPIAADQAAMDIRVRFKHEGKFIGQVTLHTIVKQSSATTASIVAEPPEGGSLTIVGDSPPPDLMIEVNRDSTVPNRFAMYLHSNLPGHRYYQKAAGVLDLGDNQTAASYTTALFASIQAMDATTAEIDLAGIGNTLWDKLPAEFQAEYWDLLHGNPAVRAIQIITDEAYIPWELLKPFQVRSGQRTDDPFWGEAYAIGRWDPARTLPQPLLIRRGNVVVPDYPNPSMKLPNAQQEISILQTLCGAQPVKADRAGVINLLRTGGWQIIHFACHGEYDAQNPDLSELLLEDSPVTATTIAAAATGVAGDKPFVFLNACEVGKQGLALTHLGGWAETFCACGFSGLAGPLWAVDDEVASKACQIFYASLKSGATLGEALQNVRKQWSSVDQPLRFNPTWLAYSLHCDPMLKVAWAPAG